jgi:lysophospholipase L1-like esterase
VFAGTSITAGNEGGALTQRGPSYPNYVGLLSAGRIEVQNNAGRPGYRIDQILGVFDTDVTPYAPSLVFIEAGTNDATQNVALTTYADYYAQYIARIRAIGARPVIILSPPNNATTARKTLTLQYKAWLRQYAAAQGIDLVDLDKLLVDTSTGAFLASLTSDGTHPKNGTNPLIAQAIVDQIVPTLPSHAPLLPTDNADPHNLVANGLFLGGTVGTSGAGGTLIPNSWSRNGARNAAVTGSLVTGDTNILGNWWRLDGAGGELDFQNLPSGLIVPNHRYVMRHRVKATNFRNANSGDGAIITAKILFNGKTSGTVGYDFRTLDNVAYDIGGTASVAFTEFVAPSDAASASIQFSITGTNISASMVFQVAQVGVYDLTAMGLAA